MPDRDRIVLKINGVPFQANRLASAQAVESTEENRDFKLGSLRDLEKLLDLIAVIKAADKSCNLGTIHSVHRVQVNQFNLYSIFQRPMKQRVVMDYGTWRYPLELISINEHLAETMELCVLADNQSAIRLYENMGFEIVNEAPGFSLSDIKPKCFDMKRK